MTRHGIVHGLAEHVYHASAGLSSTGAKKILRSPAHFQHYITHPQEPKEAFDVGTAVHAKVLGVGAQTAIYPDGTGAESFMFEGVELTNVLSKDGRTGTNASKAFELDARAKGLIPVKRVVGRVVNLMAESVLQHPIARALLEQKEGQPETSVFARDEEFSIELRARFDYLGPVAVDLKTTAGEASADGFARSVASFGYDVQQGHYLHTLELATGETPRFLFVVVENAAPYLTAVHVLDDDFARIGAAKARRARELYATGVHSGTWPGYPSDISIVRPPMYTVYDFQDKYEGTAA